MTTVDAKAGTLGILYHMPFWTAGDGTLWELEGSFARYVDSLAPYFERIVLAVPVFDTPQPSGSRVRARNVTLAPLPYFPGPRQFYPQLPQVLSRLRDWVKACDVIHLRVPSPAAIFAFRAARRAHKPVFLLVVGDYAALLPHLPYRGVKHVLFRAYVAFEEWALRYMATRALTFANGASLRQKHEGQGARVVETKTTTLSLDDVSTRVDSDERDRLKLLTVSRIDPRKGLQLLPGVVAELAKRGYHVTLDVVGAPIGDIGERESSAIAAEARRQGVASQVRLLGAVPLDRLLPMYRQYGVFVLPTLPGEGIPRVLMEAMAGGTPVVTTNVAGIASLIADGVNGRLAEADATGLAGAVESIITDDALRRRLIAGGYQTARAHTLEAQARSMMAVVTSELGVPLRPEPQIA
jgi:glycosyltransferase involved in cell wall biosynthesis